MASVASLTFKKTLYILGFELKAAVYKAVKLSELTYGYFVAKSCTIITTYP